MSSAEPRSKPASGDGNPDIQPTGARLKTLLFWGFTLGPQPGQATRLLLGNRLWGGADPTLCRDTAWAAPCL